jgi:two-component system copper resistance phosphate regulon response regulator CusR
MLELVCKGLREAGHTPMPASDGEAGLDLAMRFEFDSIILDIGLPGRDGYAVARAVRAVKRVPILMLTARDGEESVLRGFEDGADDYLTKPFSFRELLARIHALGRCSARQGDDLVVLDAARSTVYRDGLPVQLTRLEFLLFSALYSQRGATVPRHELMQAIWREGPVPSGNTLEVLVNSLRAKLDAEHATKLIVTVRGVGYRLQLSPEAVPLHRTIPPAQEGADLV